MRAGAWILAGAIGSAVVLACAYFGFAWYFFFAGGPEPIAAQSNGDGMVAVMQTRCVVVDGKVPYLVYVHRTGEADTAATLVYSMLDNCYPRPVMTWVSRSILKIKVWPSALPPTVKRTKIGDVSIVYASLDSGRFAPDARDDT